MEAEPPAEVALGAPAVDGAGADGISVRVRPSRPPVLSVESVFDLAAINNVKAESHNLAAARYFYGHVLGFKGLERPVVILAEIGGKHEQDLGRHHAGGAADPAGVPSPPSARAGVARHGGDHAATAAGLMPLMGAGETEM